MKEDKSQDTVYREDENFVDLTGTIKNLPDYCKYIPRPLIAFDLVSFRKRKSENEEWQIDENRIILFDDEEFNQIFKDGDRVRIKGELQSRNYTRDSREVDEIIRMGVKNYFEIYGEAPCDKQPRGKFRQTIAWKKLLEVGLIRETPADSMYDSEGNKEKSQDAPFVYRADENGEVFKETEHVAYEVVVKKYQKIEEEIHPILGDRNKAVLVGKITRNLYFDYLGSENKIPFCSFSVRTNSQFFEDRVFYNNVISWSDLAESTFNGVKVNDYVRVIGRLQSRTFTKELVKRWKTPSGNRKKKKIELLLTTREISASRVEKLIVEPDNKKN